MGFWGRGEEWVFPVVSERPEHHALRQRLRPWHALPNGRGTIGTQIETRREFSLGSVPHVAPLGQLFSVYRSPGGYVHIYRCITALGTVRHPWATLEGLATPEWATEMMLKESTEQIDDPHGALWRPVLIIKQVQVSYPLQRTGLATSILRDVVREFYPDHIIRGEAPSKDARAWHHHLNAIWPSRMLRFPERHRDGQSAFHRVSPGAQLDPRELERT